MLDQAVNAIDRAAAGQAEAIKELPRATEQRGILTRVVRRQLLLLLRAIRALGIPSASPIDDLDERLTGSALAAAARLVCTRAEQLQDELAAHGTPPAFRTDLARAAQELEELIDARARHQRVIAEVGPTINAELHRGRRAVEAMEVLVLRTHGHDPEVWAAWRSARKVSVEIPEVPCVP
jgi:hypothetical protein